MVGYVGVLALGTEVPDEQSIRKMRAVNFAVCPPLAMFRLDEVSVGPRRVCIGDHEIAVQCAAICQSHAAYFALVDENFLDLCVALNLAALTLDQPGHAFDNAAGATHGGPHAETLL